LNEFLFAYYDYRIIPKELLNWFLINRDEAYRKEYAVMFKWHDVKPHKPLLDFINTIEIQDDYSYINLGEESDEEVGCLSVFDVRISKVILHTNDSDIEEPVELKIDLNLDHAQFDMGVTKRGL